MPVEPRPQSRKRISIKEEVASINPLFLERQRSRYASRGIAFLVLLNGIAALLLMANLVRLRPQIENASEVASAMVVFGAGVAAALASMFFTYLRRTVRLEAPERIPSIPIGVVAFRCCRDRKCGLFCRWLEHGRQCHGADAGKIGYRCKILGTGRSHVRRV